MNDIRVNDAVETDDRYWDCGCAERYIQNKAEVPTCPNCGAHHADNPDSRVEEIANRLLHARPDLIELTKEAVSELWIKTPIGAVRLPDSEADRVRNMTDEELQKARYRRDFVDPAVLAEIYRRRRAKLLAAYPAKEPGS